MAGHEVPLRSPCLPNEVERQRFPHRSKNKCALAVSPMELQFSDIFGAAVYRLFITTAIPGDRLRKVTGPSWRRVSKLYLINVGAVHQPSQL
jgi:hypothetical protein